MLHKYKTNPKRTGQVMEEINEKKKVKSILLFQEINVDKTIIQNPQDIAKEFNKSFISVGSKLAKKVPNTEKNVKTFCNFIMKNAV